METYSRSLKNYFKYASLTFVLFLIVLEMTMRLIGWFLMLPQHKANVMSSEDLKAFRILTLGESTTADYYEDGKNVSWPRQLEKKMLKEYGLGSIRVFNGAIPSVETSYLLSKLDEYIEKFHPHLVIIMAGINDNSYSVEHTALGNSLFLSRIRIIKLYNWIKNTINYSLRRYGKIQRRFVEPLSKEFQEELNHFIKKFINSMDSGDTKNALLAAERFLKKHQNNFDMFVTGIGFMTEIYSNIYYKNAKKPMGDFILKELDAFLTRFDRCAECFRHKATIYIDRNHSSCIDTVVHLLNYYPLEEIDNTVIYYGIVMKCPTKGNKENIKILQDYLVDKNLKLFLDIVPLVSFQKNIKRMYRYLKGKNIDVIFMQYPLTSIEPLKYLITAEEMRMSIISVELLEGHSLFKRPHFVFQYFFSIPLLISVNA